MFPTTFSYNYYSFNIQKFNDNEPILINKWVQQINNKGPYVKFSYSKETFVHWLLPKNTNIIIKKAEYDDFGFPENCKGKHTHVIHTQQKNLQGILTYFQKI